MCFGCVAAHIITRANFLNNIFFLSKRVRGLLDGEIKYIFHGQGVILTANYRTVEITCRLLLIKDLSAASH